MKSCLIDTSSILQLFIIILPLEKFDIYPSSSYTQAFTIRNSFQISSNDSHDCHLRVQQFFSVPSQKRRNYILGALKLEQIWVRLLNQQQKIRRSKCQNIKYNELGCSGAASSQENFEIWPKNSYEPFHMASKIPCNNRGISSPYEMESRADIKSYISYFNSWSYDSITKMNIF